MMQKLQGDKERTKRAKDTFLDLLSVYLLILQFYKRM